jgi:hypothetical protein
MGASLIKRLAIREGLNVEARVDVSNLTNTPAFDNPLTNMARCPPFGTIHTCDPRRLQVLPLTSLLSSSKLESNP